MHGHSVSSPSTLAENHKISTHPNYVRWIKRSVSTKNERLFEKRNGTFLVLHVVWPNDDQVAFFGDEYL